MLLCGCKDNKNTNNADKKDIIVFPNAQTAATLNGYKTESQTVIIPTENATYIANTSSHKFHKSDCKFAKSTKDENKLSTNDREGLIDQGYSPCKSCKP